ncbi:MAG: methylmalonyl-CoA mutase family protein, partial [Chloroflexota bacterium]
IQEQVAATAVARAQNLATRKDVLVGTNLYANPDETIASGKQKPAVAAQPSQPMPSNSASAIPHLQSLISLAETGATLGQLTAAVRADYATDYASVQPIPVRRAAEPFEQLRAAAQAAAQKPRIFLANMGPLRQHKARADFARDFFTVGGFEIVYPDGLGDVATAVAAVRADGATAVVICSTDDTYPEIVPPLAQALKALQPNMTVILAGYPKEHVESFKAAGIDQFIYLGADCLAINQWLQQALIHHS